MLGFSTVLNMCLSHKQEVHSLRNTEGQYQYLMITAESTEVGAR